MFLGVYWYYAADLYQVWHFFSSWYFCSSFLYLWLITFSSPFWGELPYFPEGLARPLVLESQGPWLGLKSHILKHCLSSLCWSSKHDTQFPFKLPVFIYAPILKNPGFQIIIHWFVRDLHICQIHFIGLISQFWPPLAYFCLLTILPIP